MGRLLQVINNLFTKKSPILFNGGCRVLGHNRSILWNELGYILKQCKNCKQFFIYKKYGKFENELRLYTTDFLIEIVSNESKHLSNTLQKIINENS